MFTSLFYKNPGAGGSSGGALVPFLFSRSSGVASNSILAKTEAGHHKVGFDDILYMMKEMVVSLGINGYADPKKCPYLFINTMQIVDQHFLIKYTVSYQIEESMINSLLEDFRNDLSKYTIVLYGKNCADDSVDRKFIQLTKLGFQNVFIYYGGMFEWSLLQDIYGEEMFPTDGSLHNESSDKRLVGGCVGTTKKHFDILDYAPKLKFGK